LDTSPRNCRLQNAVWGIQIELVNFKWLQKINASWIDLEILPQKLEEKAHIYLQIFIEFRHQIQKSQHFELELYTVRTLLVP